MKAIPFSHPVRLLFHLNGLSRIQIEQFENVGIADGGQWEILTELIPEDLRGIGSRFLLVGKSIRSEPGDTAEELREAGRDLRVERLTTDL